jgi:hypothetical protein
MSDGPYPGGKHFAFTIVDDTDGATVANIKPIYRLLEALGMRTTKTVWPVACPEGSPVFGSSRTLDDPDYLEFILDLQRRGFEIALHGATMESSDRARTIRALERFRQEFGGFPRVHANHSFNRDSIYWGLDRVDDPWVRRVYARFLPGGHWGGHQEGSPWFWGDLCRERITYVRNLTCNDINTLRFNPSMPYRDPRRPYVQWWFSASDAEGGPECAELLKPANRQKLEREQGVCIVATHLAKGFVFRSGEIRPAVREGLEALAARPGWFPTVGELLDWLRARRGDETLPPREWKRMQRRWAWDLAVRKWDARRRAKRRRTTPPAHPGGAPTVAASR